MRRFEFKHGNSQKFWEVELEGDSYTVRFGKLGGKPQVQTKVLASDQQAAAKVDELIADKLGKGYVEVPLDEHLPDTAATAGSRNLELEAAIAHSPSEEAWQVYFDWLHTQGDPWGERGNLALAHSKAEGAAKTELAEQLAKFDAAHGDALFGESLVELMGRDDFGQVATIEDQYGLFWRVRVRCPERDWPGTDPVTVLAELIKSPAARLLHELRIGLLGHDPPNLQQGVDILRGAKSLPNLRSLMIGDFEYPEETEISWIEDGIDAGAMLKVAPKLRSLHVRGSDIELGRLEHDTLEDLTIETGGLSARAVASVGKCKLPALTCLEVWFGREGYGSEGHISQLAPLLRGDGLPKLRHLGLKNCDWQDAIALALVNSKILAQLDTLDLSMGTMHGDGIEAIIANPDKFQHLAMLDLNENYLSKHQVEHVKQALGLIAWTHHQRQANILGGEPNYYACVGE